MKINLDYYKEEYDNKPISEEYEEVLKRVENCNGEDFSKTLDNNAKIKNVLALSDVRENILNWYEFNENSTILEINANYGEITGLLCRKASKVVSIEKSKKYADIIEKRHKNKENLELIVADFSKIQLQDKFDYIVIIGVIENLEETLNFSKQYLKQDGTILLAVNNKFGLKSLITTKEEAKLINNGNTTISKNKLDNLLKGMNTKYYYPLPDYKLPNIIYTDKNMPSLSNIYRDLTYKDENVNFKEVDGYKEIIKDNPEDFKRFANSFLIEISNKEIKENDIRFITFSNIRKDEYRIKTIVKKNEVYKTNVNDKSIKHIENMKQNIDILNKLEINILDSYNNNSIISKYTEAKTLEDVLIDLYIQNGEEVFIQKIEEYKKFLKEKLQLEETPENNVFDKYKIKYEKEQLKNLNFVKYGFWDLIFQNCFIIDNNYYFYDQEWLEENIPIEYILYRAILYSHESKRYISDEHIFDKLNIKEYIPIFQELDNKIQERLRKTLVWNIHTKEELVKNKYIRAKEQLRLKDIEMQNLKNEIDELRKNNIQINTQISAIQNSLSWKITKPLRTIKRITKI